VESCETAYGAIAMREALDATIADALASLLEVFDDLPESRPFPTHTVRLPPSRHEYRVGAIELSVGAFRPDGTEFSANRRYLEVQAHTPSGASHSRAWLESGTKAELSAALQDPQTVDRVHRAIAKMAQSLEDNDFL
jgi:hypothetical protein